MAALQDDEKLNATDLSPFRRRMRAALFPWSILPPAQRTILAGGPFELFMLVVYICNMVVLAIPDTGDVDDKSQHSVILRYFDLIFCSLYLAEIGLRMVCFGAMAYRHPVRLLDLTLVCSNFVLILLYFVGVPNTNFSLLSIRCSLRVMRPFFITTNFPAVRLFVVSVTQSVLQLTDVLLLYVLFLLWFAVAGVYQFGGLFRSRCVNGLHEIQFRTVADLANVTLNVTSGDPIFDLPAYLAFVQRLMTLDAQASVARSLGFLPFLLNGSAINSSFWNPNSTFVLNMSNVTLPTVEPGVADWEGIPPLHRWIDEPILRNVTEMMAIVAVMTFMRSYVASRGLSLSNFVCGSEFLQSNEFFDDVSHLLLGTAAPENACRGCTPPSIDWEALINTINQNDASRDDDDEETRSSSDTPTHTISRSVGPPRAPLRPDVSWQGGLSALQLFYVLERRHSLGAKISCATGQTCDVTWEPDTLHGFHCPYAYACVEDVNNPYDGFVGFDNLAMGLLTLFTCVTFQLWYELMFLARDASDEFSYIYFLLVVIVGAYLIINLTVVVLTVEFEKARVAERRRLRGGEERSAADILDMSKPQPALLGVINDVTSWHQSRKDGKVPPKPYRNPPNAAEAESGLAQPLLIAEEKPEEASGVASGGFVFSNFDLGRFDDDSREDEEMQERNRAEAAAAATACGSAAVATADGDNNNNNNSDAVAKDFDIVSHSDVSSETEVSLSEQLMRLKEEIEEIKAELTREDRPWMKMLLHTRLFFKTKVVETRPFKWINTIVVVANVCVLCYSHYGMSIDTVEVFEKLNIFFTVYFTTEACCRFLAEHPKKFILNRFNDFDLFVVLLSWTDFLQIDEYVTSFSKSFRILRIIKLLKLFPSLYMWIVFIATAAKASPLLIVMLLLEMFIFSCLGMQIFGGRFCGLRDEPGPTSFEYERRAALNLTEIFAYPQETYTINCTGAFLNATGNISTPSLLNETIVNCTLIALQTFSAVPVSGQPDIFRVPHTIPPSVVNVSLPEPELVEKYLPPMFNKATCPGLPHNNFDSFPNAMITSFVILTGDDWDFVMYDAMRAQGPATAIPFVIFFYFGNYVLLNILLALLMSANVKEESEASLEAALAADKKAQEESERLKALDEQEEREEEERRKLLYGVADDEEDDDEAPGDIEDEEDDDDARGGNGKRKRAAESNANYYVLRNGKIKYKSRTSRVIDGCFKQWDLSRKYIRRLVEHMAWQVTMGIIIIFGSLCMGLEDPMAAPDTDLIRTLNTIDISITVIYIIELALNCRAYGIIRRRTSFLRRDSWNVFDFVLVGISIIGVAVAGLRDNPYIRVLKVMRALRPLRLIKQSPGMRVVLAAVARAVPSLGTVVAVTLSIFTIWGVVGVSMFGGRLRTCFLGTEELLELDIAQCTEVGGRWINHGQNFDNLAAAMLMLFQIATLEGWQDEMYRMMDTTEAGQAQRRNSGMNASFYYLFAAAFIGLFLTNLFASVLVDAYNEEKRKVSLQRSLLVTREQEAWILTNKRIARFLPIQRAMDVSEQHAKNASFSLLPLAGKVSAVVRRIRVLVRMFVHSSMFQHAMTTMIMLNFLAMAIEHYPQESEIRVTVDTLNLVFTAIFAVEAALKMFGESWRVYFSSKWNRLDLFVAVVSIISVASASVYNPRSSSLIRSLRIVRLARLTRGRFELDKLIAKLGFALVSLGHVFAVILLVFFIFAVVGMKLFGRVKIEPFRSTRGLDTHFNFQALDTAMFLLARVMTAGDWADLMRSAAIESPFCDPELGECGPVTPIPQVFFVTFVFVAMFVLKNLLTAVLLDSFESSGQSRAISKRDAQFFYRSWKHFDPRETLTISPYDTLPFIRTLPKTCILGFNGKAKRRRIALEFQLLTHLQLQSLTTRVPLAQVVDALTKMAYIVPPPQNASFAKEQQALARSALQSIATIGSPLSDHMRSFASVLTVENLQRVGSSVAKGLQGVGASLEETLLLSPEEREKLDRRAAKRAARASRIVSAGSPMMMQQSVVVDVLGSPTDNINNNASFFSSADGGCGGDSTQVSLQPDSVTVPPPSQQQQLVIVEGTDELLPLSEVHTRCAALILLNAVVKRTKDRLQKRVMKARAKRMLSELTMTPLPQQVVAGAVEAAVPPPGESPPSLETSPAAAVGEWVRIKDGVIVERRPARGSVAASANVDATMLNAANSFKPPSPMPLQFMSPTWTAPRSSAIGVESAATPTQRVWAWRPAPIVVPDANRLDALVSPAAQIVAGDGQSLPLSRAIAEACGAWCANPFIVVVCAAPRGMQAVLAASSATHGYEPHALRLLLQFVPPGSMNGIAKKLQALIDALRALHDALRANPFGTAPSMATPAGCSQADSSADVVHKLVIFAANFVAQTATAVKRCLPAPGEPSTALPLRILVGVPALNDLTLLQATAADAEITAATAVLLPSDERSVSARSLRMLAQALTRDAKAANEAAGITSQRVADAIAAQRADLAALAARDPCPHIAADARASIAQEVHSAMAEAVADGRARLGALLFIDSSTSPPGGSGSRPSSPGSSPTLNAGNGNSSRAAAPHYNARKFQASAVVRTESTFATWIATKRLLSVIDTLSSLWPQIAATVPMLPMAGMIRSDDAVLGGIQRRAATFRSLLAALAFPKGALETHHAELARTAAADVAEKLFSSFGPSGAAAVDLSEELRGCVAAAWRESLDRHRAAMGASFDPLAPPPSLPLDTVVAATPGLFWKRCAQVLARHSDAAARRITRSVADLVLRCTATTTVTLDEEQPAVIDTFAFLAQLRREFATEAAVAQEAEAIDAAVGVSYDGATDPAIRTLQRNLMIGVLTLHQFRAALAKDEATLRISLEVGFTVAIVKPVLALSYLDAASHFHAQLLTCAISAAAPAAATSSGISDDLKERHSTIAALRRQLEDERGAVKRTCTQAQQLVRDAERLETLTMPPNSVVPVQLVDLLVQMERRVVAVCRERNAEIPDNTPLRSLCVACRAANGVVPRLLNAAAEVDRGAQQLAAPVVVALLKAEGAAADLQSFARDVLAATTAATVSASGSAAAEVPGLSPSPVAPPTPRGVRVLSAIPRGVASLASLLPRLALQVGGNGGNTADDEASGTPQVPGVGAARMRSRVLFATSPEPAAAAGGSATSSRVFDDI